MNLQWDLAKKFYREVYGPEESAESLDHLNYLYKRLWYNRLPKSLMLSTFGNEFLTDQVKLVSYTFTLATPLEQTSKAYLHLNRYLTSPFYYHNKLKITFFGENDAVMLGILRSNLNEYLQHLDRVHRLDNK